MVTGKPGGGVRHVGSCLIFVRCTLVHRWSGNQMKREYDFSKAKRGPVITAPKGKVRVTIRLDEDVLTWFRAQVDAAGGGNYQTLLNDALRQHIARTREPLEETLRRVIREEIKRAS